MEKFIFTFGGNHPLEGKCQPIFAKNYSEARSKMIEIYGTTWAFQYTEKTWKEAENNKERFWPMEIELEAIYA